MTSEYKLRTLVALQVGVSDVRTPELTVVELRQKRQDADTPQRHDR